MAIQAPLSSTMSTPSKSNSHRPPRPDQLSRDAFEFITAVDQFKRDEMRSFLGLEEVVSVLENLGYARRHDTVEAEVEDIAQAIEDYKASSSRLFPNWSEIFGLIRELGYARDEDADETGSDQE